MSERALARHIKREKRKEYKIRKKKITGKMGRKKNEVPTKWKKKVSQKKSPSKDFLYIQFDT